jgi:F-type H+-transporting ATPase subunit b
MNFNLTLIAQALAFALFIWFAAKFIWPFFTRKIEERQKHIADGLAAGERGKQSLESSAKQAEAALKQARDRAAEIIAGAETRGAQLVEEAKTAAKEEGGREKAAARAEIEQQVARAKEMLREQVAALAVAGAEKILRREVNAQTHSDLLAQLKKDI